MRPPPDRLQAPGGMRCPWRKLVERRGSTGKRSTRSVSARWAKGKGTHKSDRDGETPVLPIALALFAPPTFHFRGNITLAISARQQQTGKLRSGSVNGGPRSAQTSHWPVRSYAG